MMFTSRCRGAITGQHIHEIMDADLAEIMENDGSGARDDADTDEIKGPLAGFGDSAGKIMPDNCVNAFLYLSKRRHVQFRF